MAEFVTEIKLSITSHTAWYKFSGEPAALLSRKSSCSLKKQRSCPHKTKSFIKKKKH